ncbi:MAG: hypothetical protein HY907_13570 [Deltaproteobacteria bacterium]|nr:hypothetical protein [Deltaproteobacteria bacterium]
MGRKGVAQMVVALALLGGCAKKSAPAAVAAEASKKYLPPGAEAYFEIHLPDLLGASAFREQVAILRGGLPAECLALFDVTKELSVAAYGSFDDLLALLPSFAKPKEGEEAAEAPAPAAPTAPDIAWLMVGPTKEQVLGCVKAMSHGTLATKEETRNGQTVTLLTTPLGELGLVSPEETTQAVAAAVRLDALLAAIGGGPTIDGTPLLAGLSAVPSGSVMAVANVPDWLAEMIGKGLKMLGGEREIPPPTMVALSVSLGSDISLAGAITMADEESARILEGVANAGVSMVRMMVKGLGDGDPGLKSLGSVVDSISVSRSGTSVGGRVRVTSEALDFLMSAGRPRGPGRP